MTGSHVTGGGLGTILGALAVAGLKRYAHIGVSDTDATVIGGSALAAGVGLAHIVSTVGIIPALKRAVLGPLKPKREPEAPSAAPVPQEPIT